MAYEFIAKKGLIVTGSGAIKDSLSVGNFNEYSNSYTKLNLQNPGEVNMTFNASYNPGDIYYRFRMGFRRDYNSSFFLHQEGIGNVIETYEGGSKINFVSIVTLGEKKFTLETNGYGMQMYSPYGWSSVVRYTNAASGTGSMQGALTGLIEDGTFKTWTYVDQPMIFGTNNTERVRIAANGNVGIRTTSPSYPLDVSGSGNFTGNLTVTGSINALTTVTASAYNANGEAGWTGTININSTPPVAIYVQGGIITGVS